MYTELNFDPAALKELIALIPEGKKPADLKAMIDEIPALKKKVTEADETLLADEICKLAGFTKPKLLRKIMKDPDDGFEVEVKTEKRKVEGAADEITRVAYARKKGDANGQWVPLTDYAEEHLTDYIPSLTADVESTGSDRTGNDQIVPFTRQPANTPKDKAPKGGNVATAYLESQYETPGQQSSKK